MYFLDNETLRDYIEAKQLPQAQKPFMIAVEGIDSSGKTVQSTLLQKALTKRGMRTAVIDFPNYGSFFGKRLGEMLSGRHPVRADALDAWSIALWFALDRHATLKGYDYGGTDAVIFNRYVLSNAAYQSARVQKSEWQAFFDFVLRTEYVELGLPVCDLTLVLDLPSDIAQSNMERKGSREYTDKTRDVYEENQTLLDRVSEAYGTLADYLPAIEKIPCQKDGAQLSIDAVHEHIIVTTNTALSTSI